MLIRYNHTFYLIFKLQFAFFLMIPYWGIGQLPRQTIKGVISDSDSGKPLEGANISFAASNFSGGTISDSSGYFRLTVPVGRVLLKVSHIGYYEREIDAVQVGSGKAVDIRVELEEISYQTAEININAGERQWLTPKSGASVKKLQSEDAARFAGGYFDPLRMVANMAGVTSANSDESNEIVIRGNSPRYLQWRLEGFEIPNPNHLANGQASSSGAYSAISTNVLSNFDFYTGSFPPEFGNALSGIMDLYLREGNRDKHEKGFQLSVVGAELALEGPIGKEQKNSYLFNLRYANFNFLKYLNVIDPADLSIVPSSFDLALKACFNSTPLGNFEVFGLATQSQAGDAQVRNIDEIKSGENDDFLERDAMISTGIVNSFHFKNGKTFLRTQLGYSFSKENWDEGFTDTLLVHTATEKEDFRTSFLTFSSSLSHKASPTLFFKAGVEYRYTIAQMYANRYVSPTQTDTLLDNQGSANRGNAYLLLKWKPLPQMEITPGFNCSYSGLTREILFEPRVGIHFLLTDNQAFNLGTGFHSCAEPMPIYYYRVKINNTLRQVANSELNQTRAFHLTAGYRKIFPGKIHLSIEAYLQSLTNVPVADDIKSQYSILNAAQGLPDRKLVNTGEGKNKGIEITLDKGFSGGYYFLATLSLFDSKYLAPDKVWYPSYYNSKFTSNFVAGKEFVVGKKRQNLLGINIRNMLRGGYRYTPVWESKSHEKKRIIYDTSKTYHAQLPAFNRVDFGLSYRINKPKTSYIFAADIQNLLNRHNVYRYTFRYTDKTVVQTARQGIGIVPLLSVRVEF
jgi:hypothetical protein